MARKISLMCFLLWISCVPEGPRRDKLSFQRENGISSNTPCRQVRDCASMCRDVFFTPSERVQCLQLPLYRAESAYRVAYELERPITYRLRRLSVEDFRNFLFIGENAFLDYIDRYRSIEAKRVLAWLVEDRHIAYELYAASSEDILLELFKGVDRLVPDAALHRDLNGAGHFYKIANNRSNPYVILMAHDIILEHFCPRRPARFVGLHICDFQSACVLKTYCKRSAGQYIYAKDLKYISHLIEYDESFDYIQDSNRRLGLGFAAEDEITIPVCEEVCRTCGGCY